MKCPVRTFPSIRVIRGRLSRNQGSKTGPNAQFFCQTCREDDRRQTSAVALLPQVADADTPVQ